MIGTQAILVVAIVDGDLDGHRCVYQANHSGRYPDEIGIPAICGTRESARTISQHVTSNLEKPLGD